MQSMSRLRTCGVLAIGLCLTFAGSVHAQTDDDASTRFTIGPEDVLRVFTYGHEDLTLNVTVRPDGKITIPLVQDVAVAGLTPEEVAARLKVELADVVRDPTVTVSVEAINSYRVYFIGEVNRQGPINFQAPVSVLQGIASAGGFTDFSKKELTLLRVVDGEQRQIEYDLKPVLAGKSIAGTERLLPGDTVLVR